MDLNRHKNQRDPFSCNCNICIEFWKDVFGTFPFEDVLDEYEQRLHELHEEGIDWNNLIQIGDRVSVHGKTGVVKYVGFLDHKKLYPKVYVGVKLDDNVQSLTNGLFEGKRYFYCTQGHGIMVPYRYVTWIQPSKKISAIKNSMFPSFKQIQRNRKEREKRLEEYMTAKTFQNRSDILIKNKVCTSTNAKGQQESPNRPHFPDTEEGQRLERTLKYLQTGYMKGLQHQQDSDCDILTG